MNDKEYLLQFADGKASFINVVNVSDNIKFEQRDKYLYCDNAILGHTGVSKYYDHELGGTTNKVVKIHKFDTDLLDNESIQTIIGKPITVMHPRDKYGKVKFVDGTNYKEHEVGTVLNAWRDGDKIIGNLVIKDPTTINNILEGKLKALSLGYNAHITKIGDEEYKQDEFYFNHLAIVSKGRMVEAGIVDEDTVRKEIPKVSLWEKFKDLVKSDKAVKVIDDNTVEFGDEKHTTKRYKVIEETYTYDDESGESETDLKTHEVEKDGDGSQGLSPQLGDEDITTTQEEVVEPKEDEKAEEEVVIKVADEDTQDKEEEQEPKLDPEKVEIENKEQEIKEERKDLGDEEMTEEQIKALKDEIRASLMKEITESKDAFGDINPLENGGDTKPQKYALDFDRDEALRKEAWDLATNPVRHGGDWSKLDKTRKDLFR
jgi:hypothetical protein